MNKLGADILRLWVASTDYTGEMAVSDEILKRAADSYRRIRNTARFLLANLNGFDPAKDMVKPEEMVVLDRWAVGCAKAAQEDILKAYESYDFHEVVQRLMRFCSIEMGSFYLDIIKDRQYTTKADSVARRSCQTALFHIAEALVRWMARSCPSPLMKSGVTCRANAKIRLHRRMVRRSVWSGRRRSDERWFLGRAAESARRSEQRSSNRRVRQEVGALWKRR